MEAQSPQGEKEELPAEWVEVVNEEGQIMCEIRADNPLILRRVARGRVFEVNLLDYLLNYLRLQRVKHARSTGGER